MGAVFAKTTKGHAELNKRSGLLTSKARRTLIFVDGKRSVAELEALLQIDNLRLVLGQLEEDGFIEYLDPSPPQEPPPTLPAAPPVVASPPPVAPPPMPAAPIQEVAATASRFGPLPDPAAHPKRLRAARNIMHEGILGFVGPRGAPVLLQAIAEAKTLNELRALYDRWLLAMAGSMASEWEENELREKLLRVI